MVIMFIMGLAGGGAMPPKPPLLLPFCGCIMLDMSIISIIPESEPESPDIASIIIMAPMGLDIMLLPWLPWLPWLFMLLPFCGFIMLDINIMSIMPLSPESPDIASIINMVLIGSMAPPPWPWFIIIIMGSNLEEEELVLLSVVAVVFFFEIAFIAIMSIMGSAKRNARSSGASMSPLDVSVGSPSASGSDSGSA
jgi:hypothetical protein